MKRELDSTENSDEPEWQGFPFLARVESEEEEDIIIPMKKKKANKNNKSKSQPSSSVGVVGGMFSAFVKSPSNKSKKGKNIDAKHPTPQTTSDPKASVSGQKEKKKKKEEPAEVELELEEEGEEEEEEYSIWNGEYDKFERGSGLIGKEGNGDVDNRNTSQEWLAIALCLGEQLCCVGSSKITCLKGRVEILGLILDGDEDQGGNSVIIHSPSWYGATIIKAVKQASNSTSSTSSSTSENLTSSTCVQTKKFNVSKLLNDKYPIHLLIESINGYPDLYTACHDGNEGNKQQLNHTLKFNTFKTKTSTPSPSRQNGEENNDITCKQLFIHGWCIIHSKSKFAKSQSLIQINSPWIEVADRLVLEHEKLLNYCMLHHDDKEISMPSLSSLTQPPRIMVCGSKGVGKSTFVRYGNTRFEFLFVFFSA